MKKLRIISAILTALPFLYSIILYLSESVEILENIAFDIFGILFLPSLGLCIVNIVLLYISSVKAASAEKRDYFDGIGILLNFLFLPTVIFAFMFFTGSQF